MKAVHTFTVVSRLPEPLEPLRDVAMNLGWVSDERAQQLFRRLDRENWEYVRDPAGMLAIESRERLEELAADAGFTTHARQVRDELMRSLETPRWFQLHHHGRLESVAYFSPEFGVAAALPQYSGGLGVLAGDHLKAANELGLPLVGVGLFYHHGYFRQEILLGVGGTRALDALERSPQVFHINEGHAGFLALERIRRLVVHHGLSFSEAKTAVRPGGVFTTHTPVPAGIDRFPRELMERYFTGWCREVGIPFDELMELGHEPGTPEGEVFNMAVMSLRLAGQTNAVSKLHAKVSRQMFSAVWPELPVEEVPIRSVTNGVHAQTWTSREMADLFERHLGSDWAEAPAERWKALESVPDSELWTVRRTNRERLVRYVRRRLRQIGLAKGMSESQVAWADDVLDPSVLTIGFARRFATYKRANLLLRDVDRFTKLLLDDQRPVQLIIAGKAHPADEPGKQLLQAVAKASADLDTRHRLIFLEDYDIAMARMLIAGVDVWLNTPLRPMEACGTSGMKAALNGVLNCSVLDGWWDEMYEPDIGWAIPSAEWQDDPELRDEVEANGLYNILEKQVVPLFYERDADGLPVRWLERVKRMLAQLGPKVQATRMLQEYTREFYEPAAGRSEDLAANGYERAKAFVRWKRYIFRAWPSVSIQSTSVEELGGEGSRYRFSAQVSLGDLEPTDVDVQLIYGPANPDDELVEPTVVSMADTGSADHPGWHRYEVDVELTSAGNFGFTVRAVPSHPDLLSYTHLARIAWAPSASPAASPPH